MRTVFLLIASNVFMLTAWYGHLRFKSTQLWIVILLSWLIALPEYALQVPANRIGHGQFTATQLKILQEVISISLFLILSYFYLSETPRWNEWLALLLVFAAVWISGISSAIESTGNDETKSKVTRVQSTTTPSLRDH